MKVVVLGSGILGVSSAWWLRQSGHDVVVIDRCAGPALETSFANGSQISVAYSEPWADPQAPLRLLRWMLRDDSPLLFRPQADWRQWLWGLAFLRECLPSRLAPNIRAMVAMSEYSRRTLQAMRDELGLEYQQLTRGILTFYRSQAEFDQAQKSASILRDLGVDRRIVSTEDILQIEPALGARRDLIAGGDYTVADETGDAYTFTCELARRAEAEGVVFRYSNQVTRLLAEGGRVYAAEIIGPDGRHSRVIGDAFVAALGAFTPDIVRPLGVACPVYPAKGYSATFSIRDPARAPLVSLTDSSRKVVMSRLGDRLRVAGTAEFSGYTRELNTVRCEALTSIAREWFPGDILDTTTPNYWTGLRPATPSSVPLIGRTRVANLYLNTGHGTLGWTMGPGSGKAVADIVSGRRPEPVFPYIGI